MNFDQVGSQRNLELNIDYNLNRDSSDEGDPLSPTSPCSITSPVAVQNKALSMANEFVFPVDCSSDEEETSLHTAKHKVKNKMSKTKEAKKIMII